MPRPMPVHPRGPQRRRAPRPELLLACPRLSPEWELSALAALMKPKPHLKSQIAHRAGDQAWPAGADAVLHQAARDVEERLGYRSRLHRSAEGDFFVAGAVSRANQVEGLALAAVLSKRIPELWFTYGRLFVRGGKFYRRERGFKLNLVQANNVHLPRAVRAALKGIL